MKPGQSVRILMVNSVPLNAGDAAILLGEIHALRHAFEGRVRIQVASDSPAEAAALYPEIDFVPALHADEGEYRQVRGSHRPARELRRASTSVGSTLLGLLPGVAELLLGTAANAQAERMRRADVVVATGGTYFVDHYSIRRRVEELVAASSIGVPTYLYTQSIDRFRSRRRRYMMSAVLRRVDRIFVRDRRSRANVRELGVPDRRIQVCADAAFALADPDTSRTRRRRGGRLRVAVSVRAWKHFRTRPPDEGEAAYRAAVAGGIRELHDTGAEIVFLSTCQGVPAYWADDARVARVLVDRHHLAGLGRIRIDDHFRRPGELIQELRAFDLVIATRMHMAILALIAGVPVVPIAYEFKTWELFKGLGMDDLVEDIETITAGGLSSRVGAVRGELDALRQKINARVPQLRESALEPARWIAERHGTGAVPTQSAADANGRVAR